MRAQQLLAGGQAQRVLDEFGALPLGDLDADLAYFLAVAAAKCGLRDLAEPALAHCLALAPEHPGGRFQRAVFAQADGKLQAAREDFAVAARAAPAWAEAHYNLGVIEAGLGDFAAAEASYRAALQAQPRLLPAANNLANLLCDRSAEQDAIALLQQVLASAPAFAIGWATLGRSLLRLRQPGPAIEALRRALSLDAAQGAAWQNLGDAHQLQGDVTAAAEAYARALQLEPQSAALAFKLDTLRGAQPTRPPDAYVRDLFDGMAGEFDHWLVDTLGYRLPEQLARYLPDASGLDVLDLGCGTGLAAPALRPLARRLEGADLSSNMLRQAGARGLYDALHQASLQDLLAREAACWDLLLAADVFVYVGALEPVLAAAARALRPGGWLLFSIEVAADAETSGFALQSTGRYGHSADVLARQAQALGFTVELDAPIDLRRERTQMLPGRVMRLRLKGQGNAEEFSVAARHGGRARGSSA